MLPLFCYDLPSAAHWMELGYEVEASLYFIDKKKLYNRTVKQIIIPESLLIVNHEERCSVQGRYPYSLALKPYTLTGFKIDDVVLPTKLHEVVSSHLAANHSVKALLQEEDGSLWEPDIKNLDFSSQTIVVGRDITLNFNLDNIFIKKDPLYGWKGPC